MSMQRKTTRQGEQGKGATDAWARDDDMVPERGEQVAQEERGERRDTAGEHGRMALEAAKGLPEMEER
jgi:hypothetical protein